MNLTLKIMKINKIDFNKESGRINVYTDIFPSMGFGFDIVDIVDKADLKAKVKTRVQERLDIEKIEDVDEIKFQTFKSLEGSNI